MPNTLFSENTRIAHDSLQGVTVRFRSAITPEPLIDSRDLTASSRASSKWRTFVILPGFLNP
jgi:hypothetical protein